VIQWQIHHGISFGKLVVSGNVCRGRQDGKEQRFVREGLLQGTQKWTSGKDFADRGRVEPQRLPIPQAPLDLTWEKSEALAQPQPVTGPE
jgi:hypothetical protein